jgi:superfamily II DNA or RNA helicase
MIINKLEDFILEAKIAHHNRYDYSQSVFKDLCTKVKIVCQLHGVFNQSPENHIFGLKGCTKCSKKVNKNIDIWLDEVIQLSKDIDHRNVNIKIGDFRYFVVGNNVNKNIIYEYNFDYWRGNLNKYNADEIHPDLNITFSDLYNRTVERHKLFNDAGYTVVSVWDSDFLVSQKENNRLVIHDNKYAQYITTDVNLFNKLKNILSFKTAGVEYTAAYKSGWNGINYLIDNKGYFMLGLLDKVKLFFKNNGLEYTIVDKRKPIIKFEPIDLSDRLKELGFEFRPYQHRMVKETLSNNKGIVRACTGSGKTATIGMITANINKPTTIYVIGIDLLSQFHDLFSSLFDEPIGFIGNGRCDIHRINIASIWSISSALKNKHKISIDDDDEDKEVPPSAEQAAKIVKMLAATKVHIFDESHICATDTIKSIYSKIDPEYIYGFSGTPFRDDGSDLLINGILGEQIVNVPASELIKDGYLAQPIIKFVKVPKTYIGTGTSNYQTVYKEYITENEIRNKLVVQQSKELLDKNYQVLVLFKHIQHGKNIAEMFDEQNIKYEYLSGKDKLDVRTDAKDNLLSGKSNLVLASNIFDIGVDIPSLSALILAGGGKSSIRALQRIGRVIRKHKTKKHAAIVDFYDDVRFLKGHSRRRYEIYKTEDGFKLITPKNIPEFK